MPKTKTKIDIEFVIRAANGKTKGRLILKYDLNRMREEHGPFYTADQALAEAVKIVKRKLRDKTTELWVAKSSVRAFQKLGKQRRARKTRAR